MAPTSQQLADFLEELHQDVISRASLEGDEKLLPTAFTERGIEDLVALGDLEEGEACHLTRKGFSISGYALNEDEGRLDLFVSLYTNATMPGRLAAAAVEKAVDGALMFFRVARDDLYKQLEEASPAFDMALRIHDTKDIDRIRIFIFSDALIREEARPTVQEQGAVVSFHIWDLEGLYKLARSGAHPEPIDLDIKSIGRFRVPCIEAPISTGDYRAYLAIIPGELLAAVYSAYGPRLLELNVRSYLQARGKVNAGIRNTIRTEPEHFLAYNNGISITAEKIELEPGKDGTLELMAIHDLQIVNGGQTTASIFTAWRKEQADLSRLYVAAKITVVPKHLIDEFVPFISRYANSQNKVNEADFAANDTFHVSVEKASRAIWAPAPEGTQKLTKWFYERARGSYADALAREETTAKREKFKADYPTNRRFTKTDLAKFENSWDQLPHLVSRGAEKNFREFAIALGRGRRAVTDEEYKGLVARAIMFKATERLVTKSGLVGYRANVVTYSIAYLAHATESRVDMGKTWQLQGLPTRVADVLESIIPKVYKAITEPPKGGNVGEWAKKEACWEAIRNLVIRYPDLGDDLVAVGRPPKGNGPGTVTPEEAAEIERVAAVDGDIWFAIANWARETSHLQPWQRSLAFSIGRLVKQHKKPSPKQAKHGVRILDEVKRLGFKFEA